MGNRAILGVVIVAAVAGLFFLAGGADLFAPSHPDAGEGGAEGTGAGLLGDGQGDSPDGTTSKGPSLGTVPFGRSRAQRAGRGALQGRIMDFASGAPIAKASVTLAGRGYADESVAVLTSSDDEGYFRIVGVPAGDAYVLHVDDAGQRQLAVRSQSVDAGGLTDLGTIWLGASGLLRGVVLDPAGTPVAAADVQVHPGGGSMMEMFQDLAKMLEQLDKDAQPLARGASDAQGRFEIRNLQPGPLTLVVRAAGHQQAVEKIVMTSDGAAGGDVRVLVQPADPIQGVVVDERGRGIAAARVACLEKNQMEGVFYGRQFTETDDQGRFQVASPPTRGAFAVIVTAKGYPTLLTEAKVGDAQRFVLIGGTEVVLRVLEVGTSRPVDGAQLTAMFTDEVGRLNNNVNMVSALTDAQGEARVMARPGSLGMLYLTHPERGTAVFTSLGMMGGAGTLQGPEDVTIKRTTTTLTFRLGQGMDVSGTVSDADGKPVEGARCVALGGMGLGGQAITDVAGHYRIPGQSPPITMILVTKPGYVQRRPEMGMLAAEYDPAGLTHDVTLDRAASIVGRVVDPTGRPLAGVRVKPAAEGGLAVLQMLGGSRDSITNIDGRYVLGGAAPGQSTRVMARHPGFLDSRTDPFDTQAGGATQAPDLVLVRGSSIEVRVESDDGAATARARVEVDASSEVAWDPMSGFREFADVVTRADGTVRVEDVPDGKVTLTASKKGHAPTRTQLTVDRKAKDGAHAVTLRLRRAVVLRGRVLDGDDRPVKGASVETAVSRDGGDGEGEAWIPYRTTETDAEGRFEIPDLPDVPMTVRVAAEGHRGAEVPTVPSRGDVDVRLQAIDPEVVAQLAAVDAELQKIYAAFAQVKDDAERTALIQRMQALQEQKKRLGGE